MRSARLLLATACLAFVQCVDADPKPAPERSTPAPSSWTGPVKTEHGTLLPIARIEGYGNPATGELWIREVPLARDGAPTADGVQGSAQALSRPGGYCELDVDNTTNPTLGSNPNDTFEFYTLGNVAGAATSDLSSFDPGVCETKLTANLAADSFYSNVLLPGTGSGCAHQRVKNFYARRFEHVFMDIDVWNGNYATNGPYGPGFTNGTTTTRPGRRGPSQALGLWDFGPVQPRGMTGDTVDLWIFFKNVLGGGDFNFSGHLVGEVIETCGNATDDDCDGIADNNCGTIVLGAACYSDEDCAEGLACRGAVIASKYGAANAGTDTKGTCRPAAFAGTQLATGTQHSCAITPAGAASPGRVKCWGSASSEGSGNPTDQPSASSAPLLLLGTARASSVAAGNSHSCAVFEDGSVRCWGGNWDMQARGASGTSVMANSAAPLPLDVGARAVQVVAGYGHTCVLRDDGGVRCFGANYNGECGARSASAELSLHGTQDVALGGQAAQLCAGDEHTCALLDSGAVRCWGSGAAGRLGYGNTSNVGDDEDPSSLSPVSVLAAGEITAGRSIKSIACGGDQTCAILDDGGLRCWGAGVALGYPYTVNPNKGDDELPSSLPLVGVGGPVKQVSIGTSSACALLVGGEVKCWGSTAAPNGCLGYATGCPANLWTPPGSPVDLGSGLTAIELSTRSAGATVCALLSNGAVKCWGANAQWQAGYGDTTTPISPVRTATVLNAPPSTVLDACEVDADCSPTTLCHAGMCVSRGPLRFALTWTADADFDLYVTTPSSGTIQKSNTPAGGGLLDDDEVGPNWNLLGGAHVENIAFPGSPEQGHYTFWAQNSTGPSATYTLEAFYDGVLIATDTGTIGTSVETAHFEIQYPVVCGDLHVTLGEDCDASYGCSAACKVLPGFACVGEIGEHSACSCLPGTQDYDSNETCLPLACGDGGIDGDEACDDANTASDDGCSSTCTIEAGYGCSGLPSACDAVCGDGLIVGSEECDDAGTVGGDGCSSTCTIDLGYSCTGSPSICAPNCGNGVLNSGEGCDDDGNANDDGCSAACAVEEGYACSGQPSACATVCGDGLVRGSEACDDNGTLSGNGCSSTCTIETGFACTGQPSACAGICGDGLIRGSETCDDNGTVSGNGCSSTCAIESGYSCTGQPSACATICGDGLVRGSEGCDDNGTVSGNGCSSTCAVESGYACTGEPSACATVCGDGLVRGSEGCDDNGTVSGNGCSSTCTIETGFACAGEPSACAGICGDGLIRGSETCDDSGTLSGNGCSSTCTIETGFACTGQPSVCAGICGDGLILGLETCDDGGTVSGNGCSSTCAIESGYSCTGQPSACATICGDGLVRGSEGCDDNGTVSGNGCSSTCAVESGYACSGEPSACATVCGDGLIRGSEGCDDNGTVSGNGCSSMCVIETGFACTGEPSACAGICGDGLIRGAETCDDSGTTSGNGCSSTCAVESGYACTGEPSGCATVCGDGLVRGSEGCDDNGTVSGNGCSSTCTIETGWTCSGQPSACAGICGDNLIRGAETCDDGNTAPNDGCDGGCIIEPDCNPPLTASDYGTYSGTTVGAYDDYAGVCSAGTGEDVIYKFTSPLPGKTCFGTIGSSYDTQLHLQTTCADDVSEFACADDAGQEELQLNATTGASYYAVVDGNGASGSYSFQVAPGSCCRGTLDVNGNGTGCLQFAQVSVGTYHACGITTAGTLYCWGDNGYGQLGDGSTNAHALPAPIGGAFASATDWQDVTAGGLHTCARRAGRLYCWGYNGSGQLGDNTTAHKTVPTEVSGAATNWLSVSAGNYHTCGTRGTTQGSLWCWGSDTNGQLGNGTPLTAWAAPQQVGAATDWQSVSAGNNDSTCGLRGGRVYCWGLNGDGQLGINSTQSQNAPVEVYGNLATWQSVDIGRYHACGMRGGQLFCWGWGSNGSLGTNSLSSSLVPIAVNTVFSDWQGLTVGGEDSCAWRNGGQLHCWGYNFYGEAGDGSETKRLAPAEVTGTFTDWGSVSMGFYQACGVRSGRLYCWGDNFYGQLGIEEVARRRVVTEVYGGNTDWLGVRAGPNNSCGLRGGHLYCWGINAEGEIGDGTSVDRMMPTEVTGLYSNWQAVDPASEFVCGIRGGATYCWGQNAAAGLGDGGTGTSLTPVLVSGGFTDWTSLSAGWYHACAIRNATGLLYCWGDNLFGQLGVGTSGDVRLSPTQVSGTNWTSIATNVDTTCGIRTGRLYCWGRNDGGQIGDNSLIDRLAPTEILVGGTAYTDWQAVSAGNLHTCGLRAGRVYCWGDNANGQLGTNSVSPSGTPVEVFGGYADWQELALGTEHTCALRGGQPYCWGLNNSGQVGDGTLTNRLVPTLTHGFTGWTNLTAGWSHSCAQRSGRLYCWGTNLGGQLGLKRSVSTPKPVIGPW